MEDHGTEKVYFTPSTLDKQSSLVPLLVPQKSRCIFVSAESRIRMMHMMTVPSTTAPIDLQLPKHETRRLVHYISGFDSARRLLLASRYSTFDRDARDLTRIE